MSVRRATALTISFAPIDATARPARKSGIAWQSGDVQISQSGANFAPCTNAPSEIGSTGRYALALTAAEMDAEWVHVQVVKTGIDDIDVQIATSAHPSGSVSSDAGNTATTFKTNRTESASDYWKDALLLFTSGSLAGQVKKITGYNGSTKFITLASAFTAAPSSGDRFVLVNSMSLLLWQSFEGGGSIDLTASDATATSAADTGAIAQIHSLAGASATSNPALDTGSIAQGEANQLVGADVTSVPEMDSVALNQVHVLAGAGVISTPALNFAALNQVHVLAGAGVISTPALNFAALNQVHVLAGAE
jgi:hypothetical protein